MNKDVQKHFKGYSKPNYTPVPDELFDEQLPDLSGAELKVLLYIIRRTFGFKKESDNISLNQLLHGIITKEGVVLDRGTGLSKKTLLETLKNLVEKNLILTERRRSKEKGDEPTTYRLNIIGKTAENTNTPRGVKSIPGGGVKTTPHPSDKNYTTQDTVIQETVNNTVNGVVKGGVDKSVLRELPDLGDPLEKTEYIAKDIILKALGDEKSLKFYELVAAKVPEQVIRETLAAVRADGARDPAKLFTYKIKQYALERSRGEFEKQKQGLLRGM
jgi:DNA-binding transcriptional ArsR family regulator